jgi:predicted lipid-binding transport protein (Tim44 family)
MTPDADARRFGGGSSFGMQRMQPTAPKSFSQRQAAPRNPAATNAQRGSARTGMMGMLGGLALGGLLGALFFGGAFNGINLFDILVIGGLVFLAMQFLRRKAPSGGMAYAGGHAAPRGYTDAMPASQVSILRPNINEKHFLKAARDIFMRMQTAWDAKDMEDIRRFCTSDVADKIAADMQGNTSDRTAVTTLNAQIADTWIESDLEWAAVHFNAMLREQRLDNAGNVLEQSDSDVYETWIFRHDPKAEDPTWYLAGIQQH